MAEELREVTDDESNYNELVTQSVWVSRKAQRIQYLFLDEMWNCLTPGDRIRIHSLLENVSSILDAVIRDIDRSRVRREIGDGTRSAKSEWEWKDSPFATSQEIEEVGSEGEE